MKSRLVDEEQGRRTFVVVFDKDDEVKTGLTSFAEQNHVSAGQLTAVGAFSHAVVGYFDREQKQYRRIPIDEQVEVLSVIGDIALKPDGAPEVHAHVVLGRADGSTRGGHLLEGHVWPTLEVVLTDAPQHLRKRHDPDTGLALIDPQA
jgi:uncharacterized protein